MRGNDGFVDNKCRNPGHVNEYLSSNRTVGCEFPSMLTTERIHLCYLVIVGVTKSPQLLPSNK